MAYTKFTGWANTTLPIKMRSALANIENGVEQGINAAAAAQAKADAALPKSGGTMSGAINMGAKQITNMADPTAAQHAATKAYVDAGDTTNANAAAAAKSAADAAAATANAALPKAGGTMTGAINMGSKQITHLAAPTADAHAANKKYVDDAAAGVAAQLGSYLPTAGGAMSGPIDMNSNKITEVSTPQENTDAANKKYVDDTVSPVSTVANSAASTASAANTAAANAQTAINNHKADTAVHVAFTTTKPAMDGTAAVGTATTVSRSDHVHPSDTSRAPTSHASTATTYGAASASNYGHAMASGTSPKMDGTAAVGSETAKFARGDHVHPTDTSRQATITGAATTITSSNLTASRALISNSSGKVAVSDVTSTELGYLDGVTSNIQTQLNGKLVKTTYEYNKELVLGSTGKVCIGKFPMYDSNISVEIKSTTSTTYNGTLIIATQNINTTGGGVYNATVYGDASNSLTNSIKIHYGSGSNVFSVYIDLPGWSKNLLHIQCVSLAGTPTDIATTVSSIPSNATIVPTNALKSQLDGKANSSHTHNYAGSSSAGGSATSAVKLDTATAGSATQPVYFSGGKPVATTYTLGASVPSGAKFTDTVYTHPTTSGNKHIPSGGSSGQILRWSADGTAAWGADNNTTYSAGTGISLSGTEFSNSGVRSVTASDMQGYINVNTNGTTERVYVNGLKSAAFVESTTFASSTHSHFGVAINPAAIELSPTNSSAGNGGYIDFHYNGSTGDYTSRIVESNTGLEVAHNDGHAGRILVSSNIIALYGVTVTFSSGKATYTHSSIGYNSVCIVQRRSGTAGTATTSMYATTSNKGSVTIVTDNTSATSVNLNIIIFNL